MLASLTLSLLSVALSILATAGKGSDSHGSSDEKSGEDEDYGTAETGDKKTGAQHKFWIPTYQGTNPLNRRKIGITSSEIEKYDKSIDVSLSGVYKNGTKGSKHNRAEDALSMPMIWSGEEGNINNSQKYDISMDSTGITIENSESLLSQSNETTYNDSPSKDYSKRAKIKVDERLKSKRKRIKEDKLKIPVSRKKYVEKTITSQFFDALGKATSNQTTYDADYYKKAVKAATENTKRKLGFKKQTYDTQTTSNKKNKQKPEIIAVNIDSKSMETSPKEDEIEFKTSHKQQERPEKTNTSKSTSVKLKINNTDSSSEEHDSYAVYHTREGAIENEQDTDDSFTEFCDYSAWSDVLKRNKTERKGSQRKPKTKPISSTYLESREMGRPLTKNVKDKAEKLRQKEGKTSRKKKRDKEKRKKLSKIRKGGKEDYYDQEDYPEKKLRMRTKGEKQHAIKEVKGFLKEMDTKYGGRPGRDKYKPRDGGGTRYREQRNGRDSRRGNKWDDGGDERGGEWGRGYDDRRRSYEDRRRSYDREGEWDRRERGMGRSRVGRQRDYDDRRRDDYRGRGSGRDSFRDRGRGRDGYRGRDRGRDGFRGRGSDRDWRRSRDGGRGSYRGRGSGRGGGGRGRSSGRGRRDR